MTSYSRNWLTQDEIRHWKQGRAKERTEIIRDLIKMGFTGAAHYLDTGEIPMGIKTHDAQTRSERLIAAMEDNTVSQKVLREKLDDLRTQIIGLTKVMDAAVKLKRETLREVSELIDKD